MNLDSSSAPLGVRPGEVALRPWRRALLLLRPLQILLNFIGFVLSAIALTGLGISTAVTNDAIAIVRSGGTLPQDAMVSGDKTGQERAPTLDELYAARRFVGTATGIAAASLALFLSTTALSIVWLVFTLSARARSRASCLGRKRGCSNFTADLAADAVLSVVWVIMFILACVYSRAPGIIAIQALLLVSYALSAAACFRVRKLHVQAAALAGDTYMENKDGFPSYPGGSNPI